jgi:hypothetical protein
MKNLVYSNNLIIQQDPNLEFTAESSFGGSGFWLGSCASTLHSRESVDLELTENAGAIHTENTERREYFPRIVGLWKF